MVVGPVIHLFISLKYFSNPGSLEGIKQALYIYHILPTFLQFFYDFNSFNFVFFTPKKGEKYFIYSLTISSGTGNIVAANTILEIAMVFIIRTLPKMERSRLDHECRHDSIVSSFISQFFFLLRFEL